MTDAQLAEFEGELAKLDCLTDYAIAIRCEPAAHIKLIDYMEHKRSRGVEVLQMLNDYSRQKDLCDFRPSYCFIWPPRAGFIKTNSGWRN